MDSLLETLKKKNIRIGTSSWKYTGWKDLIYKNHYTSDKDFKDNSLSEYSLHFPTVGVDHTYYTWPTKASMLRYKEQTPSDFQFVLKTTESITVFQFPNLPRYGKNAGKLNPSFLDYELFKINFLQPALCLENKLGAIFLEFSHFQFGSFSSGQEFVDKLNGFLEKFNHDFKLPLAIEIRNKNWIVPKYFESLSKNKVAHVFNSWTKMPILSNQLETSLGFDLPFFMARLLLKPGTTYKEAVDSFEPYDKVHQDLPEIRHSVVDLILQAIHQNKTAFILVNNRFEGCAPKTIEAILNTLKHSKNLGPLSD